MEAAVAQLNVRMSRDLKERGDATLSLVGSSPVKIIRQLWECLASGGDAYERVAAALSPADGEAGPTGPQQRVERSAHLFEELGSSLGMSIASFEPDLRPEAEILEDVEWELLAGKGLA